MAAPSEPELAQRMAPPTTVRPAYSCHHDSNWASLGLAGIYACACWACFLSCCVCPSAHQLPGGDNPTWIGLALGSYGLTQALLQLPLGMLSDPRLQKVILRRAGGVFALGSFVWLGACDLLTLTWAAPCKAPGRFPAAVTALLADLTRKNTAPAPWR